jgi:hypothetical protein
MVAWPNASSGAKEAGMTFLEPLLLWALPLALLPIAIHLLNLRRHRRVEWGAMQFLIRAQKQRRGHTRLRHLLILTMRSLALAALVFLISRPLAGRWFAWMGGRPDTVILLLDRSPSMEQQDLQSGLTKRQIAINRFIDALQTDASGRDLVLVSNTSSPPVTLENAAALRELPATGAFDASTDVPGMLAAALEYMIGNQTGRTDIWICSDLQSTDWQQDSGKWASVVSGFEALRQPVRFHLLTYSAELQDNVSVRLNRIERQAGTIQDQLALDIELRQPREDGGRTVPLSIILDGSRTNVEVAMTGPRVRLTNHLIPIERQREQGWGKLQVPNDGNRRDNEFFFCYGKRFVERAEIYAEMPEAAWPLRLAAIPSNQRPSDAEFSASREGTEPGRGTDEISDFDQTALVLWQGPLPQGKAAERLKAFVLEGGQLILFPPRDVGSAEFLGVRWGGWQPPNPATSFTIEQWRDDSGLLANTESGAALPVTRLEVTQYCRLEGAGQVYARLDSGDPLLLRLPTDRGGVYVCCTLPQAPYSNLARQGIVFFAMVQRALQAGHARLLADQLGEINAIAETDPGDQVRQLEGWEEGRVSVEQPFVAGVYRVNERMVAQNRPAGEDLPERISKDDLAEILGSLDYRIVEDTLQAGQPLVTEIWRWLALLLLGALIVEGLLCLPDVRPTRWPAA